MKKVGDFWVPDVDMQWLRRLGKIRRKTIRRFRDQNGGDFRVIDEALERVGPGQTAVDGGANVGAYTRRIAARFAHTIAFEPAPDTHAALEQNLHDWALTDKVIAHPWALSNRDDLVSLGKRSSQRSVSRRIDGAGDIPAIRLDSLELDTLDFLKLDLEGHEYLALEGAQNTLTRCKPAILFEDKPQKLRPERLNPHTLLRSIGAECVACLGPKQFDWLYQFP